METANITLFQLVCILHKWQYNSHTTVKYSNIHISIYEQKFILIHHMKSKKQLAIPHKVADVPWKYFPENLKLWKTPMLHVLYVNMSHVQTNKCTTSTYRSITKQAETCCTQVSRCPAGVHLLHFTIDHTSKLMTMTTAFVCWSFHVLKALKNIHRYEKTFHLK